MNQLELPMPVTGLPLEIRALSEEIHQDNIRAGWWKQGYGDDGQGDTLLTIPRNIGELIALIHSEISEADHGFELGLLDDKLPHRPMVEVELGDTAIRVLDVLGFHSHSCQASRTLPLPVDAYWPDWCRMMHRETTRALEGFRKGDTERGCNHLVDLLGIIHFAAIRFRYDLTGAIAEKRAFNAIRADHKPENRAQVGGKSF